MPDDAFPPGHRYARGRRFLAGTIPMPGESLSSSVAEARRLADREVIREQAENRVERETAAQRERPKVRRFMPRNEQQQRLECERGLPS